MPSKNTDRTIEKLKTNIEATSEIVKNEIQPGKEETVQPKTFSEADVQKMIQAAVQEALKNASSPTVVQVTPSVEKVTLRFQCECADDNQILFGMNGKFATLTGKSGTFSVPKESFFGEFRDGLVQSLLASRDLIVLDGLTDEERELYGLKYEDGEFLDQRVFSKIEKSGEEILDIFPKLNLHYREMVARRFISAYQNGQPMDRNLIVKLNKLSKKDYANYPENDPHKRGAFWAIIEAMNLQDAESDE